MQFSLRSSLSNIQTLNIWLQISVRGCWYFLRLRSRKSLNMLQCSEVSIYRSTNHVFMKLINSLQSSEVLHVQHVALVNQQSKHTVSLSFAMNTSEHNVINVFCSSKWWSFALLWSLVLCKVMSVEFNRKTQGWFQYWLHYMYVHACRSMLVYTYLLTVQNEVFVETWRQQFAWLLSKIQLLKG